MDLSNFENLIIFQCLQALVGRNALIKRKVVAVDKGKRYLFAGGESVKIGGRKFRGNGHFAQVFIGWILCEFFLSRYDDFIICVIGSLTQPQLIRF